jgi:hypothetical protein
MTRDDLQIDNADKTNTRVIGEDGSVFPRNDTGFRYNPFDTTRWQAVKQLHDQAEAERIGRLQRQTYTRWAQEMKAQGRVLPSDLTPCQLGTSMVNLEFPIEYRAIDSSLPDEEKKNVNDGELLTFSGNWKGIAPRIVVASADVSSDGAK